MTKDQLRWRYTYLWTGETAAIGLFVVLWIWFFNQDSDWQGWVARTYSLGIVIVILLQAVFWWRSKSRLLESEDRTMPRPFLDRYRRWRTINWWLIGAYPLVVIGAAQITGQPLNSADTWFGLVFLFGAILEQINYYYVQLMYDSPYDWAYLRKHRRRRQGTVAKALAEAA